MQIEQKVISAVENALQTKITGININYVKEHEFNDSPIPKNPRDVKLLPVFTIETEIGKTANIDEEIKVREVELEKNIKSLNREVLLIIK